VVTASWDGSGEGGATLPDGRYDVVAEATAADGARTVLRHGVALDRVAPTATVTSGGVELDGDGAASFGLPVALSEAARVEVSIAGATGSLAAAFERSAGAHELEVPLGARSALDRALRRGAVTLKVRLAVTDLAGNRAVSVSRFRLGSGTIDWPLRGPVSSLFGVRWGRMHEGLDLAAPAGRAIHAADGGVVVRAGWWGGYGNVVIVDHGLRTTLYGHQSRMAVRRGQVVERGQVVGYVGSTGNSTGPHLHFEVVVDGVLEDPLVYLPTRGARLPLPRG
jgi:murein DD-endopeptidase MepM/ murein hydrolase activator NlpD